MEFRILGPIEVAVDGERLPLGGLKQRALLALLVLHANQVVSRDRIVDELWGPRPPPTVESALNVYVSKLRKLLATGSDGDSVLRTEGHGYLLRIAPGQLDADVFARLADEGRRALDANEPDRAAATLRDALTLWRGQPLGDVSDEDFARAACARLEEQRLAATMDRIDAELARGSAAELIGELEHLVSEHPLNERLAAELMLALYRSGRQADALRAYQRARDALDELGIEPGAELRRLQRAILRQDPSLARPAGNEARSGGDAPAPTAEVEPPRRRRRRWAVVAAALALLGVAAGVGVALATSSDGGNGDVAALQNSVWVVDPGTGDAVAAVPVGGTPGGIAAADDGVWVANEDAGTLVKIDPETMKAVLTVGASGVTDVAVGGGGIWARAGAGQQLTRIRPHAPELSSHIPLEQLSEQWDPAEVPHLMAYGGGSLWALEGTFGIAEIDPATNVIVARIELPDAPAEIVYGDRALWVLTYSRRLMHIDPRTKKVVAIFRVGRTPVALGVGVGAVWVADFSPGLAWRINPRLDAVELSVPVGGGPASIATGAGAVWVANVDDGTISKIDPGTNTVVDTIDVRYLPTHLAFGFGKLWVTVR